MDQKKPAFPKGMRVLPAPGSGKSSETGMPEATSAAPDLVIPRPNPSSEIVDKLPGKGDPKKPKVNEAFLRGFTHPRENKLEKMSEDQLKDALSEEEPANEFPGFSNQPLPMAAPAAGKASPSFPHKEESSKDRDSAWERVDLPSSYLPYKVDALYIRRFEVLDIVRINKALKHRDITWLLDGLNATLDQDIRVLTPPDFRWVMFWHRLNSYLRSPYTVPWTSKYGNKNNSTIEQSNFIVTKIEMSPEDYQGWTDKGLALPTMRDTELLEKGGMDEDTTYLFMRAQYVDPEPLGAEIAEYERKRHPAPSAQARIDRLIAGGVGMLEDIRDFANATVHGIVERVKLRDKHFEPEKWLASLKESLKQIEDMAKANLGLDLQPQIDLVKAEINTLEVRMKNGEAIEADEEEVTLGFSAWSMFPGV